MPVIELATGFLLKTAKDSLHDWAKKEGLELIDALIKTQPFSFTGKRHAAIHNLWDSVSDRVQQPALIAAINREAEEYEKLPGLLCEYSDALPESPQEYAQITIKALPRRAINEAAMERLKDGVGKSQLLKDEKQSQFLIMYFLTDILREFDRQYSAAYNKKSPLKIGDPQETAGKWVVVGLDSVYPWPTGEMAGHYLLCNETRATFRSLNRGQKKMVEKRITDLEAKLGGLIPEQKTTLLNNIVFRTESKYSLAPRQWKIA